MARDGPEEIKWSISCDGLKRLDGVWHVMLQRDWMNYGTYWPEEIGKSMACDARRDWMEYDAQDIGWSMACDGLKRWDGVCHLMARRDWMEYGMWRLKRLYVLWNMMVRRD
jgi:hypothetical protein